MRIGIDTNILLRLFVADDPAQCAAARKLVAAQGPETIVLAPLVIAEFVRVFRRRIGRSLDETIRVLERILDASDFVIVDREIVEEALGWYRTGKVDFSDCLIVAAASRAGAAQVFTFDTAASRIPGAVLLATEQQG